MKHTGWIAVAVLALMVGAAAVAQDVEMIESHLGNEGPGFEKGMTPSVLGWGPDDQAHPDRFVVYPQDGSELVWVPPGGFPMGSTEDEVASWIREVPQAMRHIATDVFPAETPQRQVEMDGFWIAKHPVTNAQYLAFTESARPAFPERSNECCGVERGEHHPVTWVTWQQATRYARRLGMALPTEAQWEYAARGPEGHTFPWGDEWDSERLVTSAGARSGSVGTLPEGASWCGALDMVGTVAEWCHDWYRSDYYERAPDSNPPGPRERGASQGFWVNLDTLQVNRGRARVYRGACTLLIGQPAVFRAAYRYHYGPSHAHSTIGFRCVVIP